MVSMRIFEIEERRRRDGIPELNTPHGEVHNEVDRG